MNSKENINGANNFYIWFDSKNKKEYYAVPITLYKIKIHQNKNSKYPSIVYSQNNIPKISPQKNRAAFVKNLLKLRLVDMNLPYEERYGMFLVNFLNARTENFREFYTDFLYKYGLELLQHYSKSKKSKLKAGYETEEEFYTLANLLFTEGQDEIISLQREFRNCVDYVYNLNNNEYDTDVDKNIKLQGYALKFDMSKYTDKLKVIFDSLTIFKDDLGVVKYNDLNKLSGSFASQKNLKYKSTYLSNICFLLLSDIVSNNISIKSCKHCSRYFIPVSREAEIYCDLPHSGTNATCRDMGARITYAKNIQEVEGLLLYRRTYQRRLMELSRNPDTTEAEREKFKIWRKSAQIKIKEFKTDKITEDNLNKWMKKNI